MTPHGQHLGMVIFPATRIALKTIKMVWNAPFLWIISPCGSQPCKITWTCSAVLTSKCRTSPWVWSTHQVSMFWQGIILKIKASDHYNPPKRIEIICGWNIHLTTKRLPCNRPISTHRNQHTRCVISILLPSSLLFHLQKNKITTSLRNSNAKSHPRNLYFPLPLLSLDINDTIAIQSKTTSYIRRFVSH